MERSEKIADWDLPESYPGSPDFIIIWTCNRHLEPMIHFLRANMLYTFLVCKARPRSWVRCDIPSLECKNEPVWMLFVTDIKTDVCERYEEYRTIDYAERLLNDIQNNSMQ